MTRLELLSQRTSQVLLNAFKMNLIFAAIRSGFEPSHDELLDITFVWMSRRDDLAISPDCCVL